MSSKANSSHTPECAAWLDLNQGQQYRLKIRAWEIHEGEDIPSPRSFVFSYGSYQQAFDGAGGVPAALHMVAMQINEPKLSELFIDHGSARAMNLSLELQALNGHRVGEPFALQVKKNHGYKLLLSFLYQ